jgi:adenylate cyclase
MSEHTLRKLRGTYRVREVDYLVVKGKQEPVAVYEVLDYHTEQSFPNMLEAVNYFKGGLAYYRKGQWDKAIETFRGAMALNPQDKLPQIYIDRCEHLKVEPPGDDWKGIWVMKTK